jgi:hypothetical protein
MRFAARCHLAFAVIVLIVVLLLVAAAFSSPFARQSAPVRLGLVVGAVLGLVMAISAYTLTSLALRLGPQACMAMLGLGIVARLGIVMVAGVAAIVFNAYISPVALLLSLVGLHVPLLLAELILLIPQGLSDEQRPQAGDGSRGGAEPDPSCGGRRGAGTQS